MIAPATGGRRAWMRHVWRLMTTRRLGRAVGWIAARPVAGVVLTGVLSLLVSAGLSLIREPLPGCHDEFSYLLAADTFAHGRLSNPTHPCWEHFESFHILQVPRYASKYPPGQGLFLALGQWLTGRPIVGAWLGVALGTASVCWMLQGWTHPRWALLGGLLTALHHGIHRGVGPGTTFYSWSQSFWGGGPAMIGGALVFGATARLSRRPSAPTALVLAIGLVLLANTRPFEGLLVSLLALGAMGVAWTRRGTFPAATLAWRVLVPAALVLAPAAAAMALYNRAVTGSAFETPYTLYESIYNPVPIFLVGQHPRPAPEYRHAVLRDFFTGWVSNQWSRQQTLSGWWRYQRDRVLGWLWRFYVGPLAVAVLLVPLAFERPRNALAAALCLAVLAPHLLTLGIQPHYAAPAFGCFMLLIVEGLRQASVFRYRSVRVGRVLAALTLLLVIRDLAIAAQTRAVASAGWPGDRAHVEADLASRGGRHLVVVRYARRHNLHAEWVYNRADIDAAMVVWARPMGREKDARLLAYFRDRQAWLLEPDVAPRKLVPYVLPASGEP